MTGNHTEKAVGFRLPSEVPFTENERAWIDLIRLASNNSDPRPALSLVQGLRRIFDDSSRAA
ncbi:hypothetical protein [Pseudogemmobacter sp. W21_MBD1_M6]|uniref:hypothetical protein n=1 Tax=Pseudogemmobacter sp. W21_MBD1_M6 TaxID=3240271 RepID=UPI003F969DF2